MKFTSPLKNLKFLEQVVLGGLVIALLSFPLVILFTLQENNKNAIGKQALEISTAITRLRQFYATDVVDRIQDADGKAVFSENYKNVHGGIPIPATFSIEMGEIFNKTHPDTQLAYGFLSDFPFTSRIRPQLDEFQKRAITEFRNNPEIKVFQETYAPLIGEARYRLATPVRMAQSCIHCHNGHPASTKRDWAVNDIRGIQEVSVGSRAANFLEFRYLFLYFALISGLAFGSFFVFRLSARQLLATNEKLQLARQAEHEISTELSHKVDQLELLAAVADGSTFGITIADCRLADLPLVYANDAFYRMTGLVKDQVIGRNCRFLAGDLTSQEAKAGIRNAIQKGLPCTVELINYRADRSIFWNRLTLFPVGDTVGKPDYYVGYQVDVTSIREAEEERTKLQAARLIADEANSAKSDFLATMSHEIRTPLNAVIGLADVLSRTHLSSQQKELLDSMEIASAQLLHIINDVLDFSRLQSGKIQLNVTPTDVKAFLDRFMLIVGGLPKSSKLQIRWSVDASVPVSIDADEARLMQVLTNLVGNAVKFTEEGNILIEVETEVVAGAPLIKFSVSDTGPGISDKLRAQLFEPFIQGSADRLQPHAGSGLGLAICRKLVTAMGGTIELASSTPKGSRFEVVLPLRQSAPAAPSESLEIAEPCAVRCLHILVAEDTPANQMVVKLMLSGLGHELTLVNNGAEAVEAFRSAHFDVVFLDIQMPIMDGYEAARAIRASGDAGRAVPIAALTAFTQDSDREKARDSGIHHFVSKPIRAKDLKRVLGEMFAEGPVQEDLVKEP